MKKAMTIVYKVHNNLYVNLTNRCSASCTFCLRQTMECVGESDSLWLEHEPDLAEVMAAMEAVDMDAYDEVVFCGFGEPTEAWELLLKVAKYVKATYGKPIRLNTNGHGNLINGRNIAPEMKNLVDTVSISLNTPDRTRYNEIVRSKYGEASFDAMLAFAKDASIYVPNVVMTTVDTTITKEEEQRCREICHQLGVTYRIRPWED